MGKAYETATLRRKESTKREDQTTAYLDFKIGKWPLNVNAVSCMILHDIATALSTRLNKT